MKWKLEQRKLADLKPFDKNPRILTKKGMADLKQSIDKFGLAEPIVIQPSGMIIGGHGRYEVLKQNKVQEVDVYVPERQLTEGEHKELCVRLNRNIAGEFSFDILANEFNMDELITWGFTDFDFGTGDPETEQKEYDENIETKKECPKCGYRY